MRSNAFQLVRERTHPDRKSCLDDWRWSETRAYIRLLGEEWETPRALLQFACVSKSHDETMPGAR